MMALLWYNKFKRDLIITKNNMLGNNNSDVKNTFILKLRSKGEAHFEVKQKDKETGEYGVIGSEKQVEGRFAGIYTKRGEYEGDTILSYNISLIDWEDKYIVDVSMTSLWRSLANSLLSFEEDKAAPVNISLYRKGEFNNVAIRNDGELVKWKYSFAETDKLVDKAEIKGKTIRDYETLNEKLFSELEDKFGKPVEVKEELNADDVF